ncbi:DUF5667 domain-containing protein [Streptomyces natalensis]|uniref:DUF5667 domain-containing protein n=1 Tax=Streptomyces natalensis ATCC 27448 TaxID=1240678 RepID=A0A0D7CB90_9ACTN|nr:DUF5667 domain-containing protein [Streptomyces natalensis]KIZ13266.1 hypothetical protein SNA_38045 [Streptomyces natalensis ATCC 27448]
MIANVSAHRRANAFAQALEEQVLQGTAAEDQVDTPARAPDEAHLLKVTDGLGRLPKPELATEVKTVQRAQLVAAMEAAFAEGAPSDDGKVPEQRTHRRSHRAAPALGKLRPRSRLSKGLAAGGLTVGVAAGAFSGVAAASAGALPGDSLYGFKRGMEDLRLNLAGDDSDRGRLYLDQAGTRIAEARRLMERGRGGAHLDHESLAEIRRTLVGVTHDAGEGHRLLHAAYERNGSLDPIQTLNSFSKAHHTSWRELRDRLPVQLADAGDEVSSVFDAIDHEVGPLRSLLPQPPDEAKRPRHGAPAAPDTRSAPGDRATPSGGKHSAGAHGDGSHAPRPSASPSQDEGLLGGDTGGLFDPPGKTSPAPHTRHHTPAQPGVTLPPLLPGLLPGLGIDGEDASK